MKMKIASKLEMWIPFYKQNIQLHLRWIVMLYLESAANIIILKKHRQMLALFIDHFNMHK